MSILMTHQLIYQSIYILWTDLPNYSVRPFFYLPAPKIPLFIFAFPQHCFSLYFKKTMPALATSNKLIEAEYWTAFSHIITECHIWRTMESVICHLYLWVKEYANSFTNLYSSQTHLQAFLLEHGSQNHSLNLFSREDSQSLPLPETTCRVWARLSSSSSIWILSQRVCVCGTHGFVHVHQFYELIIQQCRSRPQFGCLHSGSNLTSETWKHPTLPPGTNRGFLAPSMGPAPCAKVEGHHSYRNLLMQRLPHLCQFSIWSKSCPYILINTSRDWDKPFFSKPKISGIIWDTSVDTRLMSWNQFHDTNSKLLSLKSRRTEL